MATNLDNALPPPVDFRQSVQHRRQIVDYLRPVGARASEALPKDGTEPMEGPLSLAQYTYNPWTGPAFDEVPEGSLLYCTDVRIVFYNTDTGWLPLRPLGSSEPTVVKLTTDVSSPPAGWNEVQYNNVVQDPSGLWNGSEIEIPAVGDYTVKSIAITVGCELDNTNTANNAFRLGGCGIGKNGGDPGVGVDLRIAQTTLLQSKAVTSFGAVSVTVSRLPVSPGDTFDGWYWVEDSTVDLIGAANATYMIVAPNWGLL